MPVSERKLMLRSINGTTWSLRGILLLISLLLPVLAGAQDAPDIQELRLQIQANGWSF